jgi:hypothetical protein
VKPTKRRGALLALRAVVDQPSDCLFLVALLGWVSLFLFGIYHRLHPAVDLNPLASVHVWIWIVSTVTLTIGVAFRTRSRRSISRCIFVVILADIILFGWSVFRREPATDAPAVSCARRIAGKLLSKSSIVGADKLSRFRQRAPPVL